MKLLLTFKSKEHFRSFKAHKRWAERELEKYRKRGQVPPGSWLPLRALAEAELEEVTDIAQARVEIPTPPDHVELAEGFSIRLADDEPVDKEMAASYEMEPGKSPFDPRPSSAKTPARKAVDKIKADRASVKMTLKPPRAARDAFDNMFRNEAGQPVEDDDVPEEDWPR